MQTPAAGHVVSRFSAINSVICYLLLITIFVQLIADFFFVQEKQHGTKNVKTLNFWK
jgi:hypothetical protein